MIDKEMLNIAILKSHKTKREIARLLDISEMGLYKKINAQTEFKASEILKLKNILSLTASEASAIFFANQVDFNSTT